ncbi:MAG TPA: LysR substrate-binding domain-containing protein [Candidatus Sulfotelmatobacter sp.]|jgi:DNA-binding transcriptional LysR family regulator|nr:LysR substrate-binding domain-containing protein [Candidatus Sulfotelmatobacter sp.]
MELRQLRYFVAVAEDLHFGHAAQRLRIAQPALSRQIQALEKELLVQLLFRNRRRVQITPAGQVFLDRARLILSRADEAVLAAQRAGGGVSGSLNLGFVGSATYDVLPSVLRSFRHAAPNVDLTLSEMTAHAQLEALTEKRIDIGLLRLPAKTEGIVFRTISREPLYVAMPSSHRLAQLPALRMSALAGEPFVLYPDHPRPSWTEFVIGLCQQAGFRPIIAQRTVEIQTTLSLVAAGIGVSIVPKCIGNIQRKDVAFRRLTGVRARTELLAAYRERDPSPVVQTFLKVLWHGVRAGKAKNVEDSKSAGQLSGESVSPQA